MLEVQEDPVIAGGGDAGFETDRRPGLGYRDGTNTQEAEITLTQHHQVPACPEIGIQVRDRLLALQHGRVEPGYATRDHRPLQYHGVPVDVDDLPGLRHGLRLDLAGRLEVHAEGDRFRGLPRAER